MEIDSYGHEVLRREECFQLLGTARVGRIGWSVRGLPSVLPVSFCVSDDHIVLRGGAPPAICGQVVAFQVDDLEAADAEAWSVVVTGVAFKVVDTTDCCEAIGITTELVSGHRLAVA
jgi:nitroimidazol reductase NimA-like FMN-containing flavoprotein (pyridoxamine 5'-phosphate oxidase superfamily)